MNTTTNTREVSEAMVERAWCAYDHAVEVCDAPELSEKLRVAMRAALEAALSAQQGQGEAVAWMVPRIVSFKDAVRTSCPPDMQSAIEGTVAWHPEMIGDAPPVTDRYGVTHRPRPLVYGDTAPPAQPAERVPEGEVRLWDTQWLNIVNHDNCYRDWDKADAINHAVKMTEQAIARNVADGKLPKASVAATPAAPAEEGDGKEVSRGA